MDVNLEDRVNSLARKTQPIMKELEANDGSSPSWSHPTNLGRSSNSFIFQKVEGGLYYEI